MTTRRYGIIHLNPVLIILIDRQGLRGIRTQVRTLTQRRYRMLHQALNFVIFRTLTKSSHGLYVNLCMFGIHSSGSPLWC